MKIYKKLIASRPHYKTDDMIKDYKYQTYLENNISKTKSHVNPSLNFETPANFQRKLQTYLQDYVTHTRGFSAHLSKNRPYSATVNIKPTGAPSLLYPFVNQLNISITIN